MPVEAVSDRSAHQTTSVSQSNLLVVPRLPNISTDRNWVGSPGRDWLLHLRKRVSLDDWFYWSIPWIVAVSRDAPRRDRFHERESSPAPLLFGQRQPSHY